MEMACAQVWGRKKGDVKAGKQFLGTAFFISKFHLVSCSHVVEKLANNQTLYVKLYGGGIEPIPVTFQCHPEKDLALLTLQASPRFDFVPIQLAEQHRQSVPEAGEGKAWGFTVDTDKCTPKTCQFIRYAEKHEKIAFEPKIPNGYSGGPLLNEDNVCVGVAIAKSSSTECSYAEPAYLLKQWLQELSVVIDNPVLSDWQREYLEYLVDEMQHLRSESLFNSEGGVGNKDHLSLRAIYAPLCVDNPAKEPAREKELAEEEQTPYTALQAVCDQRFSVLRGDPGCGKTTFTRYWALRLAAELLPNADLCVESNVEETQEEREEGLPESLQAVFPIHLELDKLYGYLPREAQEKHRFSPQAIRSGIDTYFSEELVGLKCCTQLTESQNPCPKVCWLIDGLDEVRIEQTVRSEFLSALNKWARQLPKTHRVCLTTRPYAYNAKGMQGFTAFNVQLLTEKHSFQFIQCFFNAAFVNAKNLVHKPGALVHLLQQAERQALLELCRNPLLLTLTCLLYFKDGEKALPNDRAGLYELCVNQVLKRWEEKLNRDDPDSYAIMPAQGIGQTKTVEQTSVHQALNKLAFYAHSELAQSDKKQEHNADIRFDQLEAHFFPFFIDEVDPKEIANYLYHKTGILIDRLDGNYAFIHRSFREYLAARYIADNRCLASTLNDFISRVKSDPGWWREVLALALRCCDSPPSQGSHPRKASEQVPASFDATALLQLCLPQARSEVDEKTAIAMLPRVFACANAECERNAEASEEIDLERKLWRERLQAWLLAAIQDEAVTATNRAEAGRYLGGLGDPRPGTGVLRPSAGQVLPDIQWADIPKGEVNLEDVDEKVVIEQTFKLAIYPITYLQFQAFIEHEQGYKQADWWQGFEIERDKPESARWREANHPRIDVSWYEATAFCRWLTAVYQAEGLLPEPGWVIRLPYEWEWQWAACSADASRTYPWQGPYQAGCANINESRKREKSELEGDPAYIGRTTAVGLYAYGCSDQGVFDLAGNVWEWCANNYKKPQDLSKVNSTDAKTLRGGAWFGRASLARAASRRNVPPDYRLDLMGFRVLCSPPSLSTGS